MKYWYLPAGAAVFFAAVFGLIVLGCGLIADKLTFLPRPGVYPELKDVVMTDVGNGERIALRCTPPAKPGGLFLLHCHGNSENLGTIAWRQDLFRRHGYGVLAFDYEGYGRSTGKASEEAVKRDTLRAWRYLTETLKVPPGRIVIHGFSLGTGTACHLASQVKEAKALVLEAPFTSIYAVANLGWIPGNRFRSDEAIRKIPFPVLIFHGSEDSVIPASHGEKLHALAAAAQKKFCRIPGAGHNNIHAVAGEDYWRQLAAFLRQR